MKMTDDMGIIYQRYYGDLYRFCISMCNNPDLAEDICHETFYKALKSTKAYDGDFYGKSENWARVVYFRAKQKIVEQLKKEGKYE